jgi:TRAP-type C4-dicarboxylate transport system substrate-binding protein
MTRVLLIVAVTAAIVVAAVVAGGGGGGGGGDRAGSAAKGGPVVLRLANANGDSRELRPFVDAVARRSGGTLRVDVRNTWRGGDVRAEAGIVRDVADGKADLGWTGARAFHDLGVRSFDALVAPLLIDNYGLEEKVVRDRLAGRMLDGLDPLGVKGVGVLPGPMRKPLGAEPLVRPHDWAGTTIAHTRSAVARDTLHVLGARGTEIPSGGSIEGADGVEAQLSSITGNRYDDVAGVLAANVNLWPRPLVVFANPDTLAKLDAGQRAALLAAAGDAVGPMLDLERTDDRDSADILCRRGVQFAQARPADLAALRSAVAPVYASLSGDAFTKAAIARIRSLGGGSAPEAPACPRAGAEPVASGRPSPVDGVWRSDITLGELERTPGYDDGENNPGNVGRFRMELRNGSFAVTGSSDGIDQRGVFDVHGDRLTFHWNDEAAFAYRWRRYRDVLELHKTGDGPTIFAVHPWRSADSAPGVGARTAIDGLYRVTTTKPELAKVSPGETPPENYGHFTWRFDRGRMVFTQHNGAAHERATGTYTVKGDRVAVTIERVTGFHPTGAASQPGEVWEYRWSRFRDQLVLHGIPTAVSPEGLAINAWVQVN